MKISKIILLTVLIAQTGCAFLYHTQIGEINSATVMSGKKFEVMVSETGVNTKEAADIAKAMTQSKDTQKQIGDAERFLSMFQMGPRTGNMVFNEKYADEISKLILKECPSGKISGLMSVREMRTSR